MTPKLRICARCLKAKKLKNYRKRGKFYNKNCNNCMSKITKEWQIRNRPDYLRQLDKRKREQRELIKKSPLAHQIYLEKARLRTRKYRARKKAKELAGGINEKE